uniref:ATP synthase F0 subunit 8 n=1 Tax=Fopius arisanus TaxID=64838 RepID=A0A8F0F6G7_9HYME|nr:ATP synthase F0 subunit 8 [Fopius arisanus]
MPQMSPMDWLMLSMFFLIVYFMSLILVYFLLIFNNLGMNMYEIKNKLSFNLIW